MTVVPARATSAVDAALERAVRIPSPSVRAYVDRLRRRRPGATPAAIVAVLERQYQRTLMGSGGAVGAAAAVPAVGTGASIALTVGEIGTFFAASSLFTLAVAEVHGIEVEDTARRKALLMATVLGDAGARTVDDLTELDAQAWARALLTTLPIGTVRRVNRVLTGRLLRRQLARQGALGLGRLLPFGVGALIGARGGRALGRTVVASARDAFGPPPAQFAAPEPTSA